MEVEVTKVFSFTETLNQGNPAAVVFDENDLTEAQMMFISKKLQVSETAFLFPSDDADFFVRFFSPTCEVDLCGHATIAAFSLFGKQYEKTNEKVISLIQKTRVGILSVRCLYDDDFNLDFVMMEQQKPLIQTIQYDEKIVSDALRISENQLCLDLPKKRTSTGLFTLPVSVDSFNTLKQMRPDFGKVKKLCRFLNVGSIHVFTFDSLDESSVYHARNFAPIYGINEDPVTGTANGAVCAYLNFCNRLESSQVICEQGDIIGKSGRVFVDVSKDTVWVGGKAAIGKSEIIST